MYNNVLVDCNYYKLQCCSSKYISFYPKKKKKVKNELVLYFFINCILVSNQSKKNIFL